MWVFVLTEMQNLCISIWDNMMGGDVKDLK